MNIRLRHDAILRVLRRSGSITIRELVEDIGASRRTILRDIGALREQGFLIHAEAGRGGGLRLDPNALQTATRISVTEVFALIISVAAMRAAGSLPFSELADTGLAKIEKTLPTEKVRDLRRLLDCLYVGKLSPKQDISDLCSIDPDLLPAFEVAFLERRLLRFRYRDAKGVETVREVEPQAMLILPPLWYLVSWDPSPNDFRHFRMDRVCEPEIMEGTRFRPRHVPFEDDVCPFSQLPS